MAFNHSHCSLLLPMNMIGLHSTNSLKKEHFLIDIVKDFCLICLGHKAQK